MEIIRVHPIAQDLPLPGHYPCLTAQLNLTRYTATGLCRMILSIREPNDHLEVYRTSYGPVSDTDELQILTGVHVSQAMAQMRWLQTGQTS